MEISNRVILNAFGLCKVETRAQTKIRHDKEVKIWKKINAKVQKYAETAVADYYQENTIKDYCDQGELDTSTTLF